MKKIAYIGIFLSIGLGSCMIPADDVASMEQALSESFYLDSYETRNDGAAGPAYGSITLDSGLVYRVTVRGTFSVWSYWYPRCGTAESAPIYPSPGRWNRYVALDAETYFASPRPCWQLPPGFPVSFNGFEFTLDSGATWFNPAPVTSNFGTHEYTYTVVGQGAALGVRIRDYPTTDNYGRMRITIELLDEDGDGVPDGDDQCPDTVSSDPVAGVPSQALGVNRWADMDGDGVFDTVAPQGKGPGLMFTIEDTAGCDCAQIIDALDLGRGHVKFGCSISAMREWTAMAGGDMP